MTSLTAEMTARITRQNHVNRIVWKARKHPFHCRHRMLQPFCAHGARYACYLAITVTIQAASRAQLDAIYQDLTACKDVLMAL